MEGHLVMVLLLTFIIGNNAQIGPVLPGGPAIPGPPGVPGVPGGFVPAGYNAFNTGQKGGGRGRGDDGRSVPQCAALCASEDCGGFDFDEGKGECFTFSVQDECGREINRNDGCCIHYQRQTACCPGVQSNGLSNFVISRNNYRATGGTQVAGANSDEQCQAACCSSPTCFSASFDYVNRVCYIHDQNQNQNQACVASPAVGFTLYTKNNRCQALDERGFNKNPNQNRVGGSRVNGVTTQMACLDYCRSRPTTCDGIDWLPNPGQCSVHSRQSECDNTLDSCPGSSPGCIHYSRIGNQCNSPTISGYQLLMANNVRGASQLSGVRNPQECATACNSDSNCAGFDWNRSQRQCWIHRRDTGCGDLIQSGCCDHYRRDRFCDGASSAYTTENGRNRQGGQRVQGVTTALDCERECNNANSCGGFDFNRQASPNECWLHTTRNECGNTDLQNSDCCDHYSRRNLNCGSGNYQMRSDNNKNGGVRQQGNFFTHGQCAALCDQRQTCGGYDWNKQNNECWLHSTQNECPDNLRANGCCDHYRKIGIQCGGGGGGCGNGFQRFNNMNRQGGRLIADRQGNFINDQTACENRCCELSNCAAIDWNPSGSFRGCYLHNRAQECNPSGGARSNLVFLANVIHSRQNSFC